MSYMRLQSLVITIHEHNSCNNSQKLHKAYVYNAFHSINDHGYSHHDVKVYFYSKGIIIHLYKHSEHH